MAKPEDRYTLKMHFELKKEGEEDKNPWINDNNYEGLNYGQLVTTQAIVIDALTKGLMSIGIANASELGFDVMAALDQIKQVAEPKAKPHPSR